MASSTKHHEGPCGPCVLCSAKGVKYTHSEKMREAEIALINKFQKRDISQACICLPCAKQVKRNVSNPNFHPRWLPKQPKIEKRCCIENCSKSVYKNTNLANPEDIHKVLQERVVAFSFEQSGSSIGLCKEHYLLLYSDYTSSLPVSRVMQSPRKVSISIDIVHHQMK